MKNQVVRAGKYATIGAITVAALPLLIPLLCLLSFVGFAFVLPLACGLAGFVYLRKYAGIIYRKLPIPGRPRPRGRILPVQFSALPSKDPQTIEAPEHVDQEFDAVVVSTPPTEVVESESDKGQGAETGPAVSSYFQEDAGEAARRVGKDEEKARGGQGEEEKLGKADIVESGDDRSYASVAASGKEKEDEDLVGEGQRGAKEEEQERISEERKLAGIASTGVQEGGADRAAIADEQKPAIVAWTGVPEDGAERAGDTAQSIDTHEEVSVTPEGGKTSAPTQTSTASGHYEAGGLLPHQANEQDIWICKDCGWRYPNAKPSAKIRRNHKKHCEGRDSPVADPEIEVPVDPLGHDEDSQEEEEKEEKPSGQLLPESPRSATVSDYSFRTAPDELPFEEEEGGPRTQEEQILREELNAIKRIVGDDYNSTGPLLIDIEQLSEFLGIDLPAVSAAVSDFEWAKVSLEVIKLVVGVE